MSQATTSAEPAPTRLSGLFGNVELTIAVLLGVVSIATAYASFNAALYDGNAADAQQEGGRLSTEAESLYLEGNQQYVQDTQVWNRLTELAIDAQSEDAVVATDAQLKYETLEFQAVSEELAAAIAWAEEENAADPDLYYSPLDNEDYQSFLFSSYADTKEQSEAAVAQADVFGSRGDALTLNTVLMSISLFLLGIAAVVRQLKVQLILMVTGVVIFVAAAVMTLSVPFAGM
ncbi:MAG: hypothetical protein JWP95_930 [Actinotalea sp.]|nr:hypothetical protein [Actinotalea sp.]